MSSKRIKAKRLVARFHAKPVETGRARRANGKAVGKTTGGRYRVSIAKCLAHGSRRVKGCIYCSAIPKGGAR